MSFFKKIFFSSLLVIFAITASGCASIVSGHNQSVAVKTTPIKGAVCELENNKGRWIIPSTPGSVMVHQSYHQLKITCEKEGFRKSIKTIASSTKPIAFGNVLFGGVIGAGVDIASGAAYRYPKDINVDMVG